MGPPSSLDSGLGVGEGEGWRDEEDCLPLSCKLALPLVSFLFAPSFTIVRAALVKLILFPLPNLLHTWPGFVRCLLS